MPQNDVQEQTRLVIAKIERIFEIMVDVLAGGGDALTVPYRSRNTPQQPLSTLQFPGRTVSEATKFSQFIFVKRPEPGTDFDHLLSHRSQDGAHNGAVP